MATGTSLDYRIHNVQTFITTSGNMDDIKQKNTIGFLVDAPKNGSFTFQLRLKRSIVSTIQICPMFADRVLIQLFGDKGVSHGANTTICNPQQTMARVIYFKESEERKKQTIRIKVQLMNSYSRQASDFFGIKYLLVRGQKCAPEKPTYKNLANKSKQKDQFFSDPKLSPHHVPLIKKEIFSERKKNKTEKNQSSINQSKEEQDYKRALQMSKQQMLLRGKDNHLKPKQQNIVKEQYSNSNYNKPRDYTKVDYQRVKDVFKYVNATWVEAQRKIEREKNVIESERLSNAIEVKIFFNKKICIDIADSNKKAELVKLCTSMGAKITQQPQQYCLLITNRLDTEKVSKGRNITGVKILKPDFVYECHKTQAYLPEKDYFHKL